MRQLWFTAFGTRQRQPDNWRLQVAGNWRCNQLFGNCRAARISAAVIVLLSEMVAVNKGLMEITISIVHTCLLSQPSKELPMEPIFLTIKYSILQIS